jgi:hypothetical protein
MEGHFFERMAAPVVFLIAITCPFHLAVLAKERRPTGNLWQS